jgi:hypothetical protein
MGQHGCPRYPPGVTTAFISSVQRDFGDIRLPVGWITLASPSATTRIRQRSRNTTFKHPRSSRRPAGETEDG